jgi:uncharacterized membrane protein
LFGYSVYLSTNPIIKISSDGFDTGYASLYNLLLITILAPTLTFLLFYKLILSNNKKTQQTSVAFYSIVYTLFVFVVQGAIGHYVFKYTFDKHVVMADWQFFTLLALTYVVSVFVVFGGLALSNPQARLVTRKNR